MRAVLGRVSQLEQRLAPPEQKRSVLIFISAGQQLALSGEECIEILRHMGPVGGVVDFRHIPHRLNAAELEKHLREHGARLNL